MKAYIENGGYLTFALLNLRRADGGMRSPFIQWYLSLEDDGDH